MTIDMREKQIPYDEQKIVIEALAESAAKPGCRFLEIGSWCGDSSKVLGKVVKKHGGHLFCIDWWKGNPGTDLLDIASKEDVFSCFWEQIRLEGLEDVVIPIRGRSDVIYEILKEQMFDMIFLDADHRYEAILGDIKRYSPLVKRDGGILCGHDCEGRISDFDMDFLEAGKDVDFHESVHCGVVLAVGSTFDKYSIDYSIWSVRAKGEEGWEATNLVFSGIKENKPPAPPQIGSTRDYAVFRYGKTVYAVPASSANVDIAEEAERNAPGVLKAASLEELEQMIGEPISEFGAPLLLDSYEDFNIVKFKEEYWGVAMDLGSINFNRLDEKDVKDFKERDKCVVGKSLSEARFLISQIILKKKISIIGSLQDSLKEKDDVILELHKDNEAFVLNLKTNLEEKEEIILGLNRKLSELEDLFSAYKRRLEEAEITLKEREEELSSIVNSFGWRVGRMFYTKK